MKNPITAAIAEIQFRREVPRDIRKNGCCGCGQNVATWHYENVPMTGPNGEVLNPAWANCDACHDRMTEMHEYNHWRI